MPAKRKSIKSNLEKVDALRDKDIDYSDIPATDAGFWKNAKVVMPPQKVHLSVRFDRDVVEWYKRDGAGYQTKMNAVLRAYAAAHDDSQRSRASNTKKTRAA